MSDLYLRLVNTPVGRTAAQSLGLPAPAPLKRLKRTDQPFIEGKVLTKKSLSKSSTEVSNL